jgi:hypothetical protein
VHRFEGERFEDQEVDAAAEEIGFLGMRGHGVRSLEVEKRMAPSSLEVKKGRGRPLKAAESAESPDSAD